MNDATKLTILRNFTAQEVALTEANANRAVNWQWESGVYVFPEAICLYCKGAMISNRIWGIVGRQLVARWKLVGGVLVRERCNNMHPNVNGASICTGDRAGVTPAQALFFGLSESGYWNGVYSIQSWMLDVFDHRCPGQECTGESCSCFQCAMKRLGQEWCSYCGKVYKVLYESSHLTHTEPAPLPLSAGDCSHGCCRECCRDRGCTYEWPNEDQHWCEWCEDDFDATHDHDIRECAGCGDHYDNEDSGGYCENCDSDFCDSCYTDHAHDFRICGDCGARFDNEVEGTSCGACEGFFCDECTPHSCEDEEESEEE